MTDTDVDPGYLEYKRQANANLAIAPDVSADDAGRAIELEGMTGAPASYIARDVKDFEDRHKAVLGQDIVGSNPYLMEYVRQHPLYGSVSQDDWHNLDGVTDAYHKVSDGLDHPWWKKDFNLIARGATGGVADVLSGIGRATGS